MDGFRDQFPGAADRILNIMVQCPYPCFRISTLQSGAIAKVPGFHLFDRQAEQHEL